MITIPRVALKIADLAAIEHDRVVLQPFTSDVNLLLTKKVEDICKNLFYCNRGVYSYKVICDASNNTDDSYAKNGRTLTIHVLTSIVTEIRINNHSVYLKNLAV